jgi:hypothetical protein
MLITLWYFFYNFNSFSTYKPSPQFNTKFLNHKATEITEIFEVFTSKVRCNSALRYFNFGTWKHISQSCMAIATFPFMTNLRTPISLVQNLLENLIVLQLLKVLLVF